MKVAILADQIDSGVRQGQTSYAFNLIAGFKKTGIDVTLLYADIPVATNYPFIRKRSYRVYNLPFISEKIRDVIINIFASKYDILHVLTNSGMPAGRSKAKKIITLHDVIIFKHPEFYTKYTLSYLIRDIKRDLQRVDAIITGSEHSKKDICEVFDYNEDKVYVIYHGIDKEIFYKQDKPRLISEDYILYVGGPHRRKGLPYLLAAFSRLKEYVPHKLLLVDNIGSRYEEFTEEFIRQALMDRIIIKTRATVDELGNYYSFAEMLVYPSLYEGFGLPPLEAMACGCPVITSNNSALKEVYDGFGLLVDPKDVENFANTMLKVISDNTLKNILKEKGLDLSIRLSHERMAQTTLESYEKILCQS